jgi:hypothetical protein
MGMDLWNTALMGINWGLVDRSGDLGDVDSLRQNDGRKAQEPPVSPIAYLTTPYPEPCCTRMISERLQALMHIF